MDKANILNIFFQSQTILDETNAIPPDIPPAPFEHLNRTVLSPIEVESVLKSLPLGKAAGPNGLSNRIVCELACELSFPYCSLFNQSLRMGKLPITYKEVNVCPVPKKGDLSIISNYRPKSFLNSENKFLKDLYLSICLIISVTIICYLHFSPAFSPVTQLLINFSV